MFKLRKSLNAATEELIHNEPETDNHASSSKTVEHDEEMENLYREIDEIEPETEEELQRRLSKGKAKTIEDEPVKEKSKKDILNRERQEAAAAERREIDDIMRITRHREILSQTLTQEEIAKQEALINQDNISKMINEDEAEDQEVIEALIKLKRVEEADNSLAIVLSKFATKNPTESEKAHESEQVPQKEPERPSGETIEEMMANIIRIKMERAKKFEQVYARKRKAESHPDDDSRPIKVIPLQTLQPGEKLPGVPDVPDTSNPNSEHPLMSQR
ncbi:uncharacterized protein LOC143612719 [Bidens hawaiensis]|uniref:uncharacterized protein LOC143612719 n=1 Tax=Bidens hawaiensis TaxID=980011 RepID=UPI0040492F46